MEVQARKVALELRPIMVNLVTLLLTKKPKDPVPVIYSYLTEAKKGNVELEKIEPILDNDLNEI